ncbi:MAG: hypothetical protein ABEN55_12400 [Bradymonadaceae bacterium]
MAQLQETLDQVDRDVIVRDVVELIDEEVNSKGGLTGMALKGGYNAVKQMRDGRMIRKAVDDMLDEFTQALEPLYEDFMADDTSGTFEDYLDTHQDRATQALLGITDRRAENADNQFLAKTYNKLRGQAEGHVTDALPRVGRLIDKHAGEG